ncbi:hypothetical protein [Flavobacterium rivuli]|uniref:hypothetical protein n=1 Tax=Flavobacterium rivuli TaxID=498301 RepID=UPI0009D94700|nr:hypothetical protein [Flavobacterium rivuli]
MKPLEFVRANVLEIKEVIKNNPDTKINDIFKSNTVIESTGVPKPELPRNVEPKKKEPGNFI